ncbi:MAG TPA: hypothetical protein PLI13_00455 [Paracoccus sp. (in: a-proteobacteria)]|nr:hypothetical protein [Paracoccus sp. (in: a-proteobacteria)]
MRFVSICRPVDGAGMEQFQPYLEAEVRYGWDNYKNGTFREIYFRQDMLGVVVMVESRPGDHRIHVVMVEADSLDAARAAVENFPLARAGLVSFETIPVGPFTNWEMLFA